MRGPNTPMRQEKGWQRTFQWVLEGTKETRWEEGLYYENGFPDEQLKPLYPAPLKMTKQIPNGVKSISE